MLSPVVVFAYNRPWHLRCTLDALNRNDLVEDAELFIFVDGAKNEEDKHKVNEVRNVIEDFKSESRFKRIEISFSDKNKGLANSIIFGVSHILSRYETVIVLEDDLVTASDFLRYMNECLVYYSNDERVGAVSAYTPKFKLPRRYKHDLFLSKRGNSWGWATWKGIWEKTDWEVSDFNDFIQNKKKIRAFDATEFMAVRMLYAQMNGQIDSWAIRWDYSFFVRGLYTVYPTKTKIKNIGLDGSGTHGVNEKQKDIEFEEGNYTLEKLEINQKMIRLSSENIWYVVRIWDKVMRRIKKVKRLLIKAYLAARPILLGLSKLETWLSAKWVQATYHRMFMLHWQFAFGREPEYFDHRMDLYYQFPVKSEAGWLERGILNRMALMTFENPCAMELCCGEGFNARHFYAPCCKSILCVDYDEKILNIAKKENNAVNIDYRVCDIKREMPVIEGGFHNIICDAVFAYFSEEEIVAVIKEVKKRIRKEGIFSGMTAGAHHEGGYVFKGVEDLKRLLSPYFNYVWVYETVSPIKHSLYFQASDGKLPFVDVAVGDDGQTNTTNKKGLESVFNGCQRNYSDL